MKKKFSKSWKKSKKARKQRKYCAKAPLHVKRKMLASHLSKDLKKKYQTRALPLRKGDLVKITRGEFKKKEGKIIKINTKKMNVFIEGIQKTRKDGTKVNVPLAASNLVIISLFTDDKKRIKSFEKKQKQKEK